MSKIVIEKTLCLEDVTIEDGGQAYITELVPEDKKMCGVFFRFQSWCSHKSRRHHNTFLQFVGKKVRLTLEVIE